MDNENTPDDGGNKTNLVSLPDIFENFRHSFVKTAEEVRESMLRSARQYNDAANSLRLTTSQIAEQIDHIRSEFGPFLKRVKEAAERFPPAYKIALLTLGEHGWYVDMEMPLGAPIDVAKAFKDGNIAGAEEALAVYFEKRLDDIERFLTVSLPSRAKVIGSAFQAHKTGQFDLSVPVLLAQTDGICRAASGKELFGSHKGKPQTAAYVETMADDIMWSAILSPLGEKLPINKSEKERGQDFKGLNRHMVLHGESLDYGTRVNSLKAISLINYVTQVLAEAKPDAS